VIVRQVVENWGEWREGEEGGKVRCVYG
jgi:hypothetical protein